ncbi:hypothetical protein KBD59_03970 [Candidatus Gracilibacteria bacterium]|nr:hypothetical protein [Candidatus Gracilibacteria bacterium]
MDPRTVDGLSATPHTSFAEEVETVFAETFNAALTRIQAGEVVDTEVVWQPLLERMMAVRQRMIDADSDLAIEVDVYFNQLVGGLNRDGFNIALNRCGLGDGGRVFFTGQAAPLMRGFLEMAESNLGVPQPARKDLSTK